ncbi:MAG: YraN family protein [Gordonibacter sp.]|uniref:YraN family protein n=1 Tax=Eggerthellaceae TaxID=1643826 RepID=UPI0022E50D00|nr:YraN family protein [Eggerthella lenta]
METTLNEKAMRGINRFLENRGFEVLAQDWAYGSDHMDFVAREDDELVFITTTIRTDATHGMGPEEIDRDSAERVALAWLKDHVESPEGTVRFDVITMVILGDHKALLRHHRNCLASGDLL